MTIKGWYKSGQALIDEMKTTEVPSNMLAIWFLGQAGIVVKSEGKLYCIDPFFRTGHVRNFEAPFSAEEADFFDYILCTHNHIDHLDDISLEIIAKHAKTTKYVVPSPHVNILANLGIAEENIIGAEVNEPFSLGNAECLPVPAAHEEFEYDQLGRMTCLGYVLKFHSGSIYHSGDTIEWEDMVNDLSQLNIDIMCLPINGSDWKRKHRDIIGNLDAREAADISAACNADLVIPMHYDLFPGNGENPAHFVDYMHYDHPGHKFHIMVPGERFFYCK